jgi:hypothetical protein
VAAVVVVVAVVDPARAKVTVSVPAAEPRV